jgi:hypothetical protein
MPTIKKHNYIALCSIICFVLSISVVFAHNQEQENQNNKFSLFFGLSHASHAVHISGGDKNIVYLPNVSIWYEAGIFYKEFGARFSSNLPGSYDSDPEINGKSEITDIQVNYLLSRHGVELFYQHYRGYYLKDYAEIPGVFSPKREDIEVKQQGANYYYVFNLGNFNLAEGLSTLKKPNEGGLSPVIMFTPSYIEISGDHSLIPISLESQFDSDKGFKGGKLFNISMLPGLGFSVIEGSSQTTMIALAGPVFQQQAYQTQDGETKRTWIGSRFVFKGRIIFEKNNIFFGFCFHVDFVNSWLEEVEVFNGYVNIGIFTGLRI